MSEISPFVPAKAGTQEGKRRFLRVHSCEPQKWNALRWDDGQSDPTYLHQNGVVPGFTKRYGVKTLVWYERHETRESALTRERQLKKWNRAWKLQIIEQMNPTWSDLYRSLSV